MKTIVVTGCAGLLGSHFSRHLLSKGYKVIGIDDLSGGYSDYLPKATPEQFEFWPLDLSDGEWAPRSLEHIFIDPRRDIVACYHFAAYAAEGLSPFIRHFNYTNNVLGSVNVINQCINHNVKLIFTSSMAVYGNHYPPFFEAMGPAPIDPYGIAKYAIEQDIRVAREQHGLFVHIMLLVFIRISGTSTATLQAFLFVASSLVSQCSSTETVNRLVRSLISSIT